MRKTGDPRHQTSRVCRVPLPDPQWDGQTFVINCPAQLTQLRPEQPVPQGCGRQISGGWFEPPSRLLEATVVPPKLVLTQTETRLVRQVIRNFLKAAVKEAVLVKKKLTHIFPINFPAKTSCIHGPHSQAHARLDEFRASPSCLVGLPGVF